MVRDLDVHRDVLARFGADAAAAGLRADGVVASPIAGQEGNREFLVALTPGEGVPDEWSAQVEAAVLQP